MQTIAAKACPILFLGIPMQSSVGPQHSRLSSVTTPLTPQSVAVFVSAGSSALDISTVVSIFTSANRIMGRKAYEVFLIGDGPNITTLEGVGFSTISFDQFRLQVDTVILTADMPPHADTRALRHWLLSTLQGARTWCAIDGGALTLADFGLVSGRRLSVREDIGTRIARAFPGMQNDAHAIFTRDDELWSCPGGSPVVDMCLALVEEECGRRTANAIAHALLVPGRRSGDQPRVSPVLMVQSRGGRDREIAMLVDWINQNLEMRLDVGSLANRASMSERNFHRRFKAYTGCTPLEYVTKLRVERARQLMNENISSKEVAGHTGFSSSVMINRVLRRTIRGREGLQFEGADALPVAS